MKISEDAIVALKRLLPDEQLKEKTIRFFAVEACCGPSVQIEITEEKPEADEVFEKDGVQFSIDPEAKNLLLNATLVFTGKSFRLEGLTSSCC
jgi:Fe-S cluster assembly iron-binding protein IscA